MNIINRKTKEIAMYRGRKEERLYITVTNKCIYFTAATSRLCGLSIDRYVHFMNDGKTWNFFVNENPDGFNLTPIVAKNAYQLTNAALNTMLLKSFGFTGEKKFAVLPSEAIMDGRPVFSISDKNVPVAFK